MSSTKNNRFAGMDAAERTAARRKALLDAALELYGTQGFGQTTVKQVCARAELSERYFYESFHNALDCLSQLYLRESNQLRALIFRSVFQSPRASDEQILRRSLETFIDFCTTDTRRTQVTFVEAVGAGRRMELLRVQTLSGFSELVARYWLGAEEPIDRRSPPWLMASALGGSVHHLISTWLQSASATSTSVMIDVLYDMFLAGRDAVAAMSR